MLRFQIETLKEANRMQREAHEQLLAERDALRAEVEYLRALTPDELLWSSEDAEDDGDPWRWFWLSYGIVLFCVGAALLVALWVGWHQ